MKSKSELSKGLFILSLIVFGFSVVSAQDSLKKETAKSKWAFLVEPYLMFPNMSGQTGIGTLPDITIDANPGDIFSRLQIGAMLNLEASNEKWTIATDVIYMDLKQDVTPGTFISSGKATAKQFAWELAGMRKIRPWLDIGIGGILSSITSGADINRNTIGGGTSHINKEISATWYDPMLIARIKNTPGKKFLYQFRGEIGGFGIGSDFAWQIQAYAGYRFSKLFQMTAGYRVISLDYEKGSEESRFKYDIDTFGPVIRFGFNF